MPRSRTALNVGQFSEVAKKIRGSGRHIFERAASGFMAKAAQPVVDATRANMASHIDTGKLSESIGVVVRVRPGRLDYNEGRIYAVIGARSGFEDVDSRGKPRDPRRYFHLLEYGAAPHEESWTGLDGKRHHYTHKGAAPYPTLRPAWDGTKDACFEAIRSGLIEAIRTLPESQSAQSSFNSTFRSTYGGNRSAGNRANRAERGAA